MLAARSAAAMPKRRSLATSASSWGSSSHTHSSKMSALSSYVTQQISLMQKSSS